MQYAQDNDETLAIAGWAGGGTPTFWHWAIYPYVKSFNVYKCPDDSSNLSSSYGVNNNCQGSISAFSNPAITAMEMDSVTGAPVNNSPDRGLNSDQTVFYLAGRVIGDHTSQARHIDRNAINILFADGHVKISRPMPASAASGVSMTTILPFADPAQPLPSGAVGTMCTVEGGEGTGAFCHAELPNEFPTWGMGGAPTLPQTSNPWVD